MGVDFVDYLHDSANPKQAWFALAALAVLFVCVCAAVGEKDGSWIMVYD